MSMYESYLAMCKLKKVESAHEDERAFNIAYGIETEVEIPIFIARKSSSAKQVKPTLKAHIENKA